MTARPPDGSYAPGRRLGAGIDDWVRVAAADAVGGPPFLAVEVGERSVLLGRTGDGEIRAFDAACPHLGNPLRQGELDGCRLACPHHFYEYDLVTGRNVFPGDDRDLALTIHQVRVVDGQVEVRLRREDS